MSLIYQAALATDNSNSYTSYTRSSASNLENGETHHNSSIGSTESNRQENQSSCISQAHWQEWRESAIPDPIIRANLQSLKVEPFGARDEAIDLLYDLDDVGRDNTGRISGSFLRKHNFLNDGGWYARGFDLRTGNRSDFLCLKPDSPRMDKSKGKPIKYEHPRRHTEIFVPGVPITEANTIAFKAGGTIFAQWEKFLDSYQGDPEFAIWEFAKTHPVPCGITEGFKKAASLCGQGYLAIALPGIWNWIDPDAEQYLNVKGEKKRHKQLTRYIKPLTQIKREFTFWFDEDSKPSTRIQVNLAQKRLGKAISKEGCRISIVSWEPKSGKGIDDAIARNGSDWLTQAYQERLSLSAWLYWNRKLAQVDHRVNKPFLTKEDIDVKAKLVGIQSAKGTAKTEAIADLCQDYIRNGIPVLVLSHRVQLAKELSVRFGIDNAYNYRVSTTKGVLGLTLCVDSLHANSQVKFNPHEWDEFVLVFDEVEQVIPHALMSNGTDIAKHRIEALTNVSALCQGASKIILSDADLKDDSIRYINSLTGGCSQSIICNDFQKAKGRKAISYPSPESLFKSVQESVQRGEKILIPTDAQQEKSTWGTINLETALREIAPDKKILRLDAQSISDEYHQGFRAIDYLEELIQEYHIVIYSPVLSTGVSIDLPGHFDAIYSFNHGTQSENSTRQFLARLRDDIPIHLFLNPIGNGKIAGGETEKNEVLRSTKAKTKRNISNLEKMDYRGIEMTGFAQHVDTYATYVATHNLGLSSYREIVLEGLRREGYSITHYDDLSPEDKTEIREGMNEIRDNNYQRLVDAIVNIDSPDETTLKQLESKQELTEAERHQLKKGKLEQRYGVEVDEELVTQDDKGLNPQLKFLFWLTVGRDYVAERDKQKAESYSEKTEGQGYEPDFNNTQYQSKIQAIEALKIHEILALEGQTMTNESLSWWWEHIKSLIASPTIQQQIKIFLGVTLSEKETPIQNLRRLLKKIGRKLTRQKQLGFNQGRQRVYKLERISSHEDAIFAQWSRKLDATSEAVA